MKTDKTKTSLTYKVYLIVISSVACCALLIGVYYYIESKGLLREEIGKELEKTARSAAFGINGNLLNLIKSSDDPFYAILKDLLLKIKTRNEIDVPINILKRKTSNRASLVLTTESGVPIEAEYKLNPTMRKAFDAEGSAFSPIYTDKDGTWISAYAPIKDTKGSMVGILELNREIGYYIRHLRFRLFKIALLCFLGCFAGFFLGIPLFKPILGSIDMLSKAAHEIEGGNYDQEIKLESPDEIGRLASDLDKMRISFKRYIEQLKEAQDGLVRSEKLAAIGKLSGIVSHELRNPLGVINNSVYFLKTQLDKTSNDKVKKHLDILEMEVNAADNIINNILSFGRIKDPLLVETDINEVVKISLKKVEIPGDVEVRTKLDGELMKIRADGTQLCHVFSNIMLNSVQAMAGGGTLTIETGKDNGYIKTSIIDTGAGIPKENLSKIFDPLFSTKPKGTGLGLSVCQGIIEKHKGTITVESEIGKGTIFMVRLPIGKGV